MATATTEPVRLPPGPRIPMPVQGAAFLALAERYSALCGRYGGAASVNLPILGRVVMISDPALARDVFNTGFDLVERPTWGPGTLGNLFGPGSLASLAGGEHLARRKLLAPPFHGRRLQTYEQIVEEEVMREIATWPEGREFETLEPMLRLTLRVILRAVFGAEGPALDELRELIPPMVPLGGLVLLVPPAMRRDFGPWTPWGRFARYRRRFDAIVDSLINDARTDPDLAERSDVLALLVQSRYENGEPLPDRHIADELLTLVGSGHETTASSLAWAVERLRRHPQLLARLTDEADAGGSELREATIWEVQRTRPVLDGAVRRTKTRIRLGNWVIPEDTRLVINIRLAHDSEANFPDATSFNPDRFVGTGRKPLAWIPFGGGVNRCVGAAFAAMEMDVALRTLLRELRITPTDTPGERRRWRGVATAPSRGAQAVVYRRTVATSGVRDCVSAAASPCA